MNKKCVALAYSGSLASSCAIAWLMERHGVEVATVTLDIGQADAPADIRARALACGAVRAHVIDARDTFARDYVLPALRAAARGDATSPLPTLAHALIARTVIDVAAIEEADAVAHSAAAAAFDADLRKLDPALPIIAPAREWSMDQHALAAYARARHLPVAATRDEPHLLIRRLGGSSRVADIDAHLDLTFELGVPVAINEVAMPLPDLIESLSLIAGQHGIGTADAEPAPAAIVLRAAYAAAPQPDATIRLTLQQGSYAVVEAVATSDGPPVADSSTAAV